MRSGAVVAAVVIGLPVGNAGGARGGAVLLVRIMTTAGLVVVTTLAVVAEPSFAMAVRLVVAGTVVVSGAVANSSGIVGWAELRKRT